MLAQKTLSGSWLACGKPSGASTGVVHPSLSSPQPLLRSSVDAQKVR